MIYFILTSNKKTMKFFQAKNQSIEVKDLVTFIAEQTEEEVKQVQMLNNMKAELEKLKLETNSQQVKIAELEKKIAELEALKQTQEQKIQSLNAQVKTAQEQQAQQKREFLCLVSM